MTTQFNGNLGLFEIDKIVRKTNFYELRFKNDNRIFAGTFLHSFQTEDGESKNLRDLCSKDKIWIDISAYTADKSLYIYNPFGTLGRYQRAIKTNKNN